MLYPQLWYARQVSLFQLLEVYVVVDVYRFPPGVPAQLLDELPPHSGPPQVRSEPMPAAVRAEMALQVGAARIMQPGPNSSLSNHVRKLPGAKAPWLSVALKGLP